MSNMNGSGGRGAGWSPELLTVLGAVLAVGVALGTLIFTGLNQVRKDMSAVEARLREDMGTMETRLREDMGTMETRLREDMGTMEARIREDMGAMEGRLREDTRELRGDVGLLRERVSTMEGRLSGDEPSRTSLGPSSNVSRSVFGTGGLAGEQGLHRLARARCAGHDGPDLLADRHLDPEAPREPHHVGARLDTFDDLIERSGGGVRRQAPRECETEAPVA